MKAVNLLLLFFHINVHPYENYRWRDITLPKEFLNEVATGVKFALDNEAARQISFEDLDHFHLLLDPSFKGENVLKAIMVRHGILLHTQEKIDGDPNEWKRNIVVMNGTPRIVIPFHRKGFIFFPRTVLPEHLDFQYEEFWSTGYIIDVTNLKTNKRPKKNVIVVNGKILYIGFTRGIPPDAKTDELPGYWGYWRPFR